MKCGTVLPCVKLVLEVSYLSGVGKQRKVETAVEIGHARLPGSLMMVVNPNTSGAPGEHVGGFVFRSGGPTRASEWAREGGEDMYMRAHWSGRVARAE